MEIRFCCCSVPSHKTIPPNNTIIAIQLQYMKKLRWKYQLKSTKVDNAKLKKLNFLLIPS